MKYIDFEDIKVTVEGDTVTMEYEDCKVTASCNRQIYGMNAGFFIALTQLQWLKEIAIKPEDERFQSFHMSWYVKIPNHHFIPEVNSQFQN